MVSSFKVKFSTTKHLILSTINFTAFQIPGEVWFPQIIQ